MSKKKKKTKQLKVIDSSGFTDEKTRSLLETIKEDTQDMVLKGIITVVVPAKGRPLLYTNLRPEEAFLHTYRATGLIAGMITTQEEEEEYGNPEDE